MVKFFNKGNLNTYFYIGRGLVGSNDRNTNILNSDVNVFTDTDTMSNQNEEFVGTNSGGIYIDCCYVSSLNFCCKGDDNENPCRC